ncbi:MAG: ribosome-associated translation inhibitor RaiA [bacterium]|jgi:putative sigma-54 modulation protein|nr:ribosome-associated translation inhibitor RaiA [bacterium]
MKTTVTSRHFRASDKLKAYAETEVSRLDKYFDSILECDVVLEYDARQNKTAEVAIRVPGEQLQAAETSEDFQKSLDLAVLKLEKQVVRYKERLKKKH